MATPKKISNRELFRIAKKSCRELRLYLQGELELSELHVVVRRGFIKEASNRSLYFFAKEVLGFDKLTPQTHRRWADDLQRDFLQKDYFGRLKPRGTFKTTLYGQAFMLWVWATFDPRIRFFYTSANDGLLEDVSAHLDHFIGFGSESLYAFVFGIRRDRSARKNTNEVVNIVGRDPSKKGASLMMRPLGASTNGVHPHIIICDDPCDVIDRESQAVREKKKRAIDSLHPLLVPFEHTRPSGETVTIRKMMLVATRWHLQDVIGHLMTKENWDFEVEGVYDEDGNPRYPELLPEEKIRAIQEDISEVFFACQYLNDPLPEGVQIFSKSKLFFVRRDQFDVTQGTNYCFFDASQGKQASDYPAVIWVNLLNGRKVLFHAVDKKIGLYALVKLIAKTNMELGVRVMVFETNGAMDLEEKLFREHQEIGYSLYLEPIHETRNKYERINAMQPDLYNGTFFFREDYEDYYPELMNQVLFYPAWQHDDFPDVIEKANAYFNTGMPGSFAKSSGGSAGGGGSLAGSLSGNTTRSQSW